MSSAELIIARAKEQRQHGDTAAAETSYAEAAALAQSEGLPRLRAHALRHVSELAAARGAGSSALDAAEEALSIYRSNRRELPLNVANAHRVRALAFSSLGRTEESARDWRSARKLYAQLGVSAGVAECDRRLKKS
jgi:hypothetical protein